MLIDSLYSDGYAFLPQGDRLWQVPPPPAALAAENGPPALSLLLFRYPVDARQPTGPAGGGILSCALDLAPAEPRADSAALPLLSGSGPATTIASPAFTGGEATLWLEGARLAAAAIPPGTRPVVALACVLPPTGATLLKTAAEAGKGLLVATVDGHLEVAWSGPPLTVELDVERCTAALRRRHEGSIAPREVPEACAWLVAEGLVRIAAEAADPPSPETMALLYAHLALHLLTAAPTGGPAAWSTIPGLEHDGALKPRDGRGRVRLLLGEKPALSVAYFAAAVLPPVPGAVPGIELVGSRLASLELILAGMPGRAAVEVDLALPGGLDPHLVIGPQESRAVVHFVRPTGADPGFHGRYRMTIPDVGPYEQRVEGPSTPGHLLLEMPRRLTVRVLPDLLVGSAWQRVEAELTAGGGLGEQRRTLELRAPFAEPGEWSYYREPGEPAGYRHRLTFFDQAGMAHEQPETADTADALVLRPPPSPPGVAVAR